MRKSALSGAEGGGGRRRECNRGELSALRCQQRATATCQRRGVQRAYLQIVIKFRIIAFCRGLNRDAIHFVPGRFAARGERVNREPSRTIFLVRGRRERNGRSNRSATNSSWRRHAPSLAPGINKTAPPRCERETHG